MYVVFTAPSVFTDTAASVSHTSMAPTFSLEDFDLGKKLGVHLVMNKERKIEKKLGMF